MAFGTALYAIIKREASPIHSSFTAKSVNKSKITKKQISVGNVVRNRVKHAAWK